MDRQRTALQLPSVRTSANVCYSYRVKGFVGLIGLG